MDNTEIILGGGEVSIENKDLENLINSLLELRIKNIIINYFNKIEFKISIIRETWEGETTFSKSYKFTTGENINELFNKICRDYYFNEKNLNKLREFYSGEHTVPYHFHLTGFIICDRSHEKDIKLDSKIIEDLLDKEVEDFGKFYGYNCCSTYYFLRVVSSEFIKKHSNIFKQEKIYGHDELVILRRVLGEEFIKENRLM